jgi:hypothetical protein
VNKETLEQVSFGLDLVQLAAHIGSFESPLADSFPAEAGRLRDQLQEIAVRRCAIEPAE